MKNWAGSSVYSVKASVYGSLPWVREAGILCRMFADWRPGQFDGVIDLGCGPGILAQFVARHLDVGYLGVDCTSAMIREAVGNLRGIRSAKFACRDISDPRNFLGFNRPFVVLKNVLHVLPDWKKSVRAIAAQLPKGSRIVIVETVSPTVDSLEWIQSLYLLMGRSFKRNWFVRGELIRSLNRLALKHGREDTYRQYIDLLEWGRSFGLEQSCLSLALSFVDRASPQIRSSMEVARTREGGYRMLRLQEVIVLHV